VVGCPWLDLCRRPPPPTLQPEEVYYTCAWSVDGRSGDPLLAIAGLRGVIKIINCVSQAVVRVRMSLCEVSSAGVSRMLSLVVRAPLCVRCGWALV
jgi:hypothetical protein